LTTVQLLYVTSFVFLYCEPGAWYCVGRRVGDWGWGFLEVDQEETGTLGRLQKKYWRWRELSELQKPSINSIALFLSPIIW